MEHQVTPFTNSISSSLDTSAGAPHWGRPGAAQMLVLTGPTGCGKTVSVRLLTQQLGIAMVPVSLVCRLLFTSLLQVEYVEGGEIKGVAENVEHRGQYLSRFDRFRTFLLQSTRSSRLHISNLSDCAQPRAKIDKHLVLLDELPNSSTAELRTSLRGAINEYLSKGTGSTILIASQGRQVWSYTNHVIHICGR